MQTPHSNGSLAEHSRATVNASVPSTPLAIVGIGCLFPKAAGPGRFWANIKRGIDCITEVPSTHWNPDDYFDPDPKRPDMTYARRGGFLDVVDFNPLEHGIAPRDLEATDTTQLLGLVAAKQALVDAGILPGAGDSENSRPSRQIDRSRISVILGVTGTLELVIPLGARLGHPKWKQAMKAAGIPDELAEDAAERIAESYVPWQENSFPGLLGNVVAGRIANRLDLGGTNCVVDAACASSLSAVHLAALELQAHRADVVVTGGCDTFNDIFMYMCFSKTPALSPTGNARPFDAAGDGTILGEGLGVVVLKRLADAERDGDTIYAVLKGIGSSSDGKGNAIYAPSAAGQKNCLRNAYAQAGVTPDTIELLEAHGTGTRVGDATEASALMEVYSSDAITSTSPNARPWCALGSVKSQIGHTKAAAGAASLIKATLALHYKVLPPTIKVSKPVDPLGSADSPFYVNTVMRPWLPRPTHPRRAALSAFGFGGSNFHAVLEEYQADKREVDWDGSVEILALAAETPQELAETLESVPHAWTEFARFAEKSRSTLLAEARCRLCVAAHESLTDLPRTLGTALAKLRTEPDATSWRTPDGVYYGSGPAPGKLAVLFPGQGSQSVGMLRDLACLFPELLESLSAANAAIADTDHANEAYRLSDRIYPPPTFDANERNRQEVELRDTRNAQPALGAVSFGAWRVLAERFGIRAAHFAGHSYGELVALTAAGRLAPSDLWVLSRLRGQLMAGQRDGDRGAMLAVLAPFVDVARIMAEYRLDLTIANRNAPRQMVVSGANDEIERATQFFAEEGIKTARLPVAAAFHSPFVADAAIPLRSALESIDLKPSAASVFANTTASEYPDDPAAAKELLAQQLAKPVAFVDEIRAMVEAGAKTFVEVGPGCVLTRLAESILAELDPSIFDVFALDQSAGKRPGVLDLAHALARLTARGHTVQLSAWEHESRCRPRSALAQSSYTVALNGANYVNPRPARPARKESVLSLRNNPQAPPIAQDPSPAISPATSPVMPEPNADALAQALLITQQSLAALQRMQEQTAALHKQFLESQEAAQRTLHSLVEQQQTLLASSFGSSVALPTVPTVARTALPAPTAHPARQPALDPAASAPMPSATPPPASMPKPAPKASPPAAKKTAIAESPIASTLLAVVSEKTGYPVESLDLTLSLDADLGVDSIKRVEILSTLQERLPNAPVVKPEHLGTLHTLRDVANFLGNGHSNGTAHASDSNPRNGDAQDEEELIRTMPISKEQLLLLAKPDSSAKSSSNRTASVTSTPSPRQEQSDVAYVLVQVVAEKTGYPPESLDLSLSLDADLGVDSIKRVEILSTLQERLPSAPVVKPEHLGALHTLRDVANFLAGSPQPPRKITPPATTKIPIVPVVPPAPLEELSPALDTPVSSELLAPETVQLSSIQHPSISDSILKKAGSGSTRESGTVRQPAYRSTSEGSGTVHASTDKVDRSILQSVDLDLSSPRSRVPLTPGGEIWVVGESDPLTVCVADALAAHDFSVKIFGWSESASVKPGGPVSGLVLIAPIATGLEPDLNRQAFDWVKLAGPKLRQMGRSGAAVFTTVSRLDGAFGLADLSAEADPTSGGLAGLVKTARHEWPEVTCKAIDLAPAFSVAQAAGNAVVEEILTAGPVEVGIASTHRCTLELARTVRRTGNSSASLGARDVILITGGARGVTAEVAVALAESYSPTLILTGRTPLPGAEPAWLSGLSTEPEMKRAIAANIGPDAIPKQVGEYYQKVMGQREVRRTLDRIAKTAAKAAYFPVNITDGKAVADLLQQVRVKFGPITALVHGAGVLADKRLEDLSSDQFDQVYSTKVEGLRNLLDLLAHEELKALLLFSSTTARFGRIGQAAYACANEVLNKSAQVEARRRPGCRVVSINWGPWDGGMVTPGLRKMFESEGIGLISLADGGHFLIQELVAAGKSVEVIALGKHRGSGVVPVPSGLPGSGAAPLLRDSSASSAGMAASPAEFSLAFERTVDIASHPVLNAHVLNGRAVLPMSLHIEWLAHAALHGNPGLVFHGFNDLRVTQAVGVDAGLSVQIRAFAGKAVKQDKSFVVPVELRGGRRDGRELIHSRAEIILVSAIPPAPPADRPPSVTPLPYSIAEAYRDFLFHGHDLQGIERIEGASESAFIGTSFPAPVPGLWFQSPLRSSWVAEPLVLDASFQMMILWTRYQHDTGSLPCFAGRYRQYRKSFPTSPTTIVIRIRRDDGKFARADLDYLDSDGRIVAQMQDYECVMEKNLNQTFQRSKK